MGFDDRARESFEEVHRMRNYIGMSSGPGLLSLDFDNLEREEVVACRPRVPDHEELVQEAVTSKILIQVEQSREEKRKKKNSLIESQAL